MYFLWLRPLVVVVVDVDVPLLLLELIDEVEP